MKRGRFILIGFLIPTHILTAKVHAKFIKNTLNDRQKSLNLTENLSGLFEQSLTFWRIILPINEPVGKNKKTRVRLNTLIEQSKDFVQSLNDQFSYYQDSQNNTTTELNSLIQNNNN